MSPQKYAVATLGLVGTVKIVSSVAVIVALSVSVTVNGVLYPGVLS